ncbi:MAG: ATP-binding protein, partial [Dietzia sp.]
EVRVLGTEFPTTPGIEHELLRIAGEALSNAARHSQGDGVVVTLDFSDEAVGLTVEDDGVGRPEDLRRLLEGVRTGSPDERHGLVNMRERAELVGGEMRIAESGLGGVAITVVAPRVDGVARRSVR